MSSLLKLHEACQILGIQKNDRPNGWPESFNIKQISRLYYPNDPKRRNVMLSMLDSEVKNGNLSSNKTEFVTLYAISNRGCSGSSGKEFPVITKLDFKNWESRPDIPDNSPLSGWIDSIDGKQPLNASGKALSRQNNEFNSDLLLNKPKKKDDWFEAINDMSIDFHGKHNKLPNKAQAWTQLLDNPPHGYEIAPDKDKAQEESVSMAGQKPLSKSAFNKRWEKYTKDTNKQQKPQ